MEQTRLKNSRETNVGKKAHSKFTGLPSDKHNSNPNQFLLVFCSCLLLIIASLALAIQIRPASAAYETFDVHPGESIQAAVEGASDHDIIRVYPGVYNEHITIPYTLSYLSLVGDPNDPTTTIINGTRTGTIFVLEQSGQNPYPSCHYINITGFTIRNAGDSYAAISIQRSNIVTGANDYHNISKNIIENSEIGISLGTSHRNIILDNTFLNNSVSSIETVDADYNKISGNTIQESTYGVKLLSNAINNVVINNTITQTSYAVHVGTGCHGTTIRQNTVSGKTAGIYINSNNTIVDHNTATEGAYGIWLYTAYSAPYYHGFNGTITYNTFKNNSYGIKLQGMGAYPSKHKFYNNKAIYNDWGIQTEYSNNNTFVGNWLQQNTYGAQLTSSNYNLFYRNNFIYNIVQASTNSFYNDWYKDGNGNHWSNWISPDANNNGIVDNWYSIPPGQPDKFPLVRTWSEHDISLESVTPSTYSAYAGTIIDITVTVKNRANTSVSETFTVTSYNSTTPFETIRIDNEYIYRDVTTLGTVSVGDIRLTAVSPYTAGSTVATGNSDIGQSLVAFASNEKHTGSGEYNPPGEYIYRDITTLGTVSVGDVRLVTVGSYLAGSIVATGNTDIGQSLVAFASNEKHRENIATNNIYEPGLNTNATKTLTFHWNTTGVAAGNYTITAKIGPVTDELNTDNNNKSPANQIKIKVPLIGDINNDEKVNFTDLDLLNQAYGSKLGDPTPPWNQSADLNRDNIIDTRDLKLLSENFGKIA